ncbi:MAG: hypothetical protein GF332_00290 [Candidatus Moranbacteria bacterium]|nr:hypothetical protein [Candidatus Moranbacteria bacterium]
MKTTKDLKVKLLGIIPQYQTRQGSFNAQEVAAFSGLLTFRGDSVEDLVQEAQIKKQDINQKIKYILRKSALRGHASMATMPVFCFTFEGSKMIGSMLTGITFSSALMHSGRRASVTTEQAVCPKAIANNPKAYRLYQKTSNKLINTFNQLLKIGIIKDEASKIIHYGTYGTGIITFPVESLGAFLKEYQLEKQWMPEEGEILLKALESKLKQFGVDLLYSTRAVAPRNAYPFPNLFKDPAPTNLVRDLVKRGWLKNKQVKIFQICNALGKGFKNRILEIQQLQEKLFNNPQKLKQQYPRLLACRRELIRDYSNGLNIKSLSRVSWRVWRDKKRHRTAPVATESIYYCLDRALRQLKDIILEFKANQNLKTEQIAKINRLATVPPGINKNKKTRTKYLEALLESLQTYQELIGMGVKPGDAVYIIPRAFRIDMVQEYNLHNLIDGYYPLRSCPTADEQIFRQTKAELKQIKAKLAGKNLAFLNALIEPKCVAAGFCPEEKTCGYIKTLVKGYNQKMHQDFKDILEQKFQAKLKAIND